jgi:nucleotide-binding universal stress UspA family protein
MFNNVVWATDGSAHADRALEYAEQLVARDGGTLHIVHIVEKLVGGRVAGLDANLKEGEIEAKIRDQARAAEHDGFHVELHVAAGRSGDIFRAIADEAAAAGGDVIVVGTRGRSAVMGAVIGSVTQRLLHVAGCPVLAVPPTRDGEASDPAEGEQPEPAADPIASAS